MSKTPKNPTLQDIADRADVSRMTVSLALRHSSRIRQSTRERIERIAKEMDYRPNPLVSAHMSHLRALKKVRPQAAIGFLARWSKEEFKEERHYNVYRMYQGACEKASALGYSVEYHDLFDREIRMKRLNQILLSRGVEGLILAQTGVVPAPEDIEWSRFAIAASQFSHLPFMPHRTMSDVYSMIWTIVSEVWSKGYRKMGLIVRHSVEEVLERRRVSAFLGALNHYQANDGAPFLLFDSLTDGSIEDWVEKQDIDVLLTEQETYERLLESGYTIPQDFGVAMLNFPKRSWLERDEFAGYNHNFELVGASLVELVVEQLNLNQRGEPSESKSVLIKGEWRDGKSLEAQKTSK